MINKYIEKYSSLPITIKATFWFTICNFILKGISFITVPIFAALLPTDEYGKMSIYYSYEQIFTLFATFELSIGAYQRGILKFKNDEKLFTSSLIVLGNIITFINLFIFSLFNGWIVSFTNISSTVILIMFIYFLFQPAYMAWLTKKRFDYKYRPAVIATIAFTFFTTVFSLINVYLLDNTANVKVLTMLIVEIIFCIPFYVKSLDIYGLLHNRSKVKKYFVYCLKFQTPLLLHSLSYLVLSQSDRIMIGSLVNNSKAAIYSVAYNLASVIIIFQQSINQVFKPWRYQKLESKDYKNIHNTTTTITILIAILICMFIIVVPEVISLLFNDIYYEAIWTIPPVSIGVFFMYIYSIFSDVETYFHKTKYMAYASVMCAIINVILNFIGIKYFGYIACAYTTLITYIIFSIAHYYFMKKIMKENGIIDNIYNLKAIIIISILILLFGLIITILYNTFLLRYIFLIIILVVVFLKRNTILALFKNLKTNEKEK